MVKEDYDACIIGAGIAGATLARMLSPELDVCLIEEKPLDEIGEKPCGNAVHRTWLEQGGDVPSPEDYGSVSAVSRLAKLHLPSGDLEAELSRRREMLILDRKALVGGLVESAIDSGCDLFTQGAVPRVRGEEVREVGADGTSVTAETYIDSSGAEAVLRREFEPTPEGSFFTGYREVVEGEIGDGACHVFQTNSNHALWAFPMGGKTNIGGGLFWEDGVDLKREVARLRKDLGLDGEVLDSGFGPVPSSKPIDLVHGNSVAIGDAGLTANPLTGGGIGPSIKAANLLADVLKDGGGLGEFQDDYMEEVAGSYERNYYLNRGLLKLQRVMPEKISSWAFKKFYGGKPVDG